MMIKNIATLAKKEIKDAFTSPLVFVLAGFFSSIIGWLFFNYLMQSKQMTSQTMTQTVIVPIFGNINFLLMFICPLITMKSFSEEKKNHTLDLLLRSNLSEIQVILGKFISNTVTVLFVLAFTLIFPLILSFTGYNDWGVVFGCYLGVLLSVMSYIAVGIFCSSLTDNQIVASLLTFCILLGTMLLVISTNATDNYLMGLIIQYFAIAFHYEGFTRGLLRSYSFIYFFSLISFCFLLTLKSLQSRKW